MRQPRKRRNISLAVLAVGVTYFLVTVFATTVDPRDGAVFGSLVAACFVALFGLVGTIAYHVTHQRRERLLRGERLLARWTVSPDQWRQFIENERRRATAGRDNAVQVRSASEATGIEVVVTEESLMVDDDAWVGTPERRSQCRSHRSRRVRWRARSAGRNRRASTRAQPTRLRSSACSGERCAGLCRWRTWGSRGEADANICPARTPGTTTMPSA